ncbi:MAG TPA: hypothetical protein VNI54_01595 [Thermoanaerobaculia bacterium]|nr:hypothetical protein [Thermoanaerobaculia bacterium]
MAVQKADVNIRLQGYPLANRDASVSLVSEATGRKIETRPFLDGTVMVRDLDPGLYELEVRHPNLVMPIEKRRIRVFPQPQPTQVNIQIPQVIFKDSKIEDIPDMDLTPVQTASAAARTSAQQVGGKLPGEAILAADWNLLAGAVADLAAAVGQLTLLVAPRGHDHPEIAAKIDEVQGNLRAFAEAFGKTVLEIRRRFEVDQIRKNTEDVLSMHDVPPATKKDLFERIDKLQLNAQKDTPQYTQQLANVSAALLDQINEIAVQKGEGGADFLADKRVAALSERTKTYRSAGTQTRAENELLVHQRSAQSARNVENK